MENTRLIKALTVVFSMILVSSGWGFETNVDSEVKGADLTITIENSDGGDLTVQGSTALNGNTTLGDDSNDTTTVKGALTAESDFTVDGNTTLNGSTTLNGTIGTSSGNIFNTTTNGFNYVPNYGWSINSDYENLLLTTQNQSSWIRFYYQNGGQKGSISFDGTGTSYNTTSDQRLKTNIQDAEEASNTIDAIQVRQFDWKSDGSHQDYGMIAQELLEVAPEAVTQPDNPEDMMGVDYSKLVPMLVKEIQSLRQRVEQLENSQ